MMRTLIVLVLFSAITANSKVLFSEDFSSPGLSNGNLNKQGKWKGQEQWNVDTSKGQLINNSHGYLRMMNLTSPTDGRGFFKDDQLKITMDVFLCVPGTEIRSRDLLVAGIIPGIGPDNEIAPDDGLGISFDRAKRLIFVAPDLNQMDANITLSFDELGIEDIGDLSDHLRLEWSAVMVNTDSWTPALKITNLDSGQSWEYTGEKIFNQYSSTKDALFSMQKNTESPEPLIVTAITYEYDGMYATETLGLPDNL